MNYTLRLAVVAALCIGASTTQSYAVFGRSSTKSTTSSKSKPTTNKRRGWFGGSKDSPQGSNKPKRPSFFQRRKGLGSASDILTAAQKVEKNFTSYIKKKTYRALGTRSRSLPTNPAELGTIVKKGPSAYKYLEKQAKVLLDMLSRNGKIDQSVKLGFIESKEVSNLKRQVNTIMTTIRKEMSALKKQMSRANVALQKMGIDPKKAASSGKAEEKLKKNIATIKKNKNWTALARALRDPERSTLTRQKAEKMRDALVKYIEKVKKQMKSLNSSIPNEAMRTYQTKVTNIEKDLAKFSTGISRLKMGLDRSLAKEGLGDFNSFKNSMDKLARGVKKFAANIQRIGTVRNGQFKGAIKRLEKAEVAYENYVAKAEEIRSGIPASESRGLLSSQERRNLNSMFGPIYAEVTNLRSTIDNTRQTLDSASQGVQSEMAQGYASDQGFSGSSDALNGGGMDMYGDTTDSGYDQPIGPALPPQGGMNQGNTGYSDPGMGGGYDQPIGPALPPQGGMDKGSAGYNDSGMGDGYDQPMYDQPIGPAFPPQGNMDQGSAGYNDSGMGDGYDQQMYDQPIGPELPPQGNMDQGSAGYNDFGMDGGYNEPIYDQPIGPAFPPQGGMDKGMGENYGSTGDSFSDAPLQEGW